jgi:serine/threonine protein kinase
MGAVYLVMDNRLGNKRCALKEMSGTGIHDPAERRQAVHAFRQEAQMLSNLSHPGLPRVTDYFSQANKHFLVMDYVDGQSLLELLETRTTPFPVSRVLDWGLQLCDVLAYLHRQVPPIIYRDLKPENIIASTNRERVRLIDFGAARTYKPKQGKDTTAIGTPGYAPPEQYGKGQTDSRSDVYALGATLHQLLTLHDPGIKLFDFPPVRSLNSGVPEHVETAIEKALEENIHKRWSSISEFKKALESQESKPGPKPKPSAPRVATTAVPAVAGKSASSASPAHVVSKPVSSRQKSPTVSKGKVAGYGPRFWAYVIDNLILTAGGFLIAVPFLNASDDAIPFMLFLMAVWALGYYTYFHSKTGQTPGKRANHVKVICQDGSTLTWPRAFWRSLSLLVLSASMFPLWFIGWLLYLIPLMDKDNRALHDFFSGTWVVEA